MSLLINSQIIIYNKYDFLNPNIIIDEKRKQFLFSQVAIKNNEIPNKLLNYHKSAPNQTFLNSSFKSNEFNYKLGEIQKEDLSQLPHLFKSGSFEKLESKWTMHKKSFWYKMEILKIKDNYSIEYFKEFFECENNHFEKIVNNRLYHS